MFYFKTTFIIITLIIAIFCCFACDSWARRYAESIRESAVIYGLDPGLLFAIADVESGFDPNAVSSAGAIGIMQIMPKTGEWIATCLLIENYSNDLLLDPSLNICFGAFYLSYLFDRFDEVWQVVAAYNAGEGIVKEWVKSGLSCEEIPYLETNRYVQRVEKAFRYYQGKKFVAFD